MATVCRAAPLPPVSVSSASAIAGKPRIASWFQIPVSVTASATSSAWKPQASSIAAETPTPTTGPPGARYVPAVEACVTVSACRKRRPGSAAIQGGANVTMFSRTVASKIPIHAHESIFTWSQTAP